MSNHEADYFGARLKELREAAGLTQKQLGEAAGLTLNGITQFEMGRRKPSWESVLSIAKALGVSVEAFTVPPKDTEKRKPGRQAKAPPTTETAPPPASKRKGKG